MDDANQQRANSVVPSYDSPSKAEQLKAAIARFSRPEFFDEITRLFGEAKDKAILERDRLANEKLQSR